MQRGVVERGRAAQQRLNRCWRGACGAGLWAVVGDSTIIIISLPVANVSLDNLGPTRPTKLAAVLELRCGSLYSTLHRCSCEMSRAREGEVAKLSLRFVGMGSSFCSSYYT